MSHRVSIRRSHLHRSTLGFLAAVLGLLAGSDASDAQTQTLRASRPKIQVCHVSRVGALRIIEVGSKRALQDHLDHGDNTFGAGLDESCEGGVSFEVDESLVPSRPTLPGIDGGPPRDIGAVRNEDGVVDEFVLDEVQLRVENPARLQQFIANYGATVLRDDTLIIGLEGGGTELVPGGGAGWHLLRVDPSFAPLLSLPSMALAAGFEGALVVSSLRTARLAAIGLAEQERGARLNFLRRESAILEHPDGSGGNIDFAEKWWMEHEGISVSVVRAWDYLRHTGLPPNEGVWRPGRVALVDDGFDVDPTTGLGHQDFNNNPFSPPLQADIMDYDGSVGGNQTSSSWHGQGAFGACCAYPRNLFGGAGSGGDLVRPILIRAELSAYGNAMGIRTAALMSADVISISSGGECGFFCRTWNDFTDTNEHEAIQFAQVYSLSTVMAAAGNGPDNKTQDHDASGDNILPCRWSGVVCVGAIDRNANNKWNWGNGGDIWAPTDLLATFDPNAAPGSEGEDALQSYGGTSAASPFAAGIVGLMKASNASLFWSDVEQILQDTANPSSDPKVGTGYVDALAAVQAVRANPPPVPIFLNPTDGQTLSHAFLDSFFVVVDDDPAPLGFVGDVEIISDRDGHICRSPFQDARSHFCVPEQPVSLGAHEFTAVATDEFGAEGSTSIGVTLTNQTPSLNILAPAEGASYFTSQFVPLWASVVDDDPTGFPDDQITWSSDVDGLLPATGALTSAQLSAGDHVITGTATDEYGETGEDSVSVTIVPGGGIPSVQISILGPIPGFPGAGTGEPMTFKAIASDPEDITIPGSNIEWSSDRDGFLGTGETIEATLSGPGCESFFQHEITVRATDSDGNVATDTIEVEIGQIC
jgi:hypothetical protein